MTSDQRASSADAGKSYCCTNPTGLIRSVQQNSGTTGNTKEETHVGSSELANTIDSSEKTDHKDRDQREKILNILHSMFFDYSKLV